jgi:hypothetical protein
MREADRDKMMELGYHLIKGDDRNSIWVFDNDKWMDFAFEMEVSEAGISYILSDVLTF